MADNETPQGQENQGTSAGTENAGREAMIPRARFDEVLNRARAAEEAVAKIQRDMEARKEAELAEQKKWQELADERARKLQELEPQAQRVKDLEEALQALVKAQIEQIPEGMRGLVPEFPDPRQTLDWLAKNAALLSRPAAPNLDAGAGRGGTEGERAVKLDPTEERIRQMTPFSPEEWQKLKQEGQRQAPVSDDVIAKLREQDMLAG